MRLTTLLIAGIGLALAQFIVGVTHAPAPMEGADITAHGHVHGDEDRDLVSGHDAADHEHQLQALAVGPDDGLIRASGQPGRRADITHASLPRDGPRRPPRAV